MTLPRLDKMPKAVKRKAEDLGYGLAEGKSLSAMTPQEIKYMNAEFEMVANNKKLAERAIKMLTDQKGLALGCQVDLFEHALQTATRCYHDVNARTKVRTLQNTRAAAALLLLPCSAPPSKPGVSDPPAQHHSPHLRYCCRRRRPRQRRKRQR